MPFWAYMLHCRGGVFYTGHTDDLEKRVAEHKSGLIKGFTSKYLPVELVWSEEFPTRIEALEAEQRIKRWSRAKKLALIRSDWGEISRLAKGKNGPSTSSGRTEVAISIPILRALIGEARAAFPRECCGILLGNGQQITGIAPARNIHETPETRFEIDPQALVDAHREARSGGPEVLGYYHSHPSSAPEPSATDSAMAAGDGSIWAIVGEAGDITFWKDGEAGFEPLPYAVEQG